MAQAQFEQNRAAFEVDDVIVFLLGAKTRTPSLSGQIDGITRLEKLIFLLQKESDIGRLLTEDPEFHAHHFGPFSSSIYHAVDTLKTAGLIEERLKYSGSAEDAWETANIVGQDAPYSSRAFRLTELGNKYYIALEEEFSTELAESVGSFKDRFASMPLRQLVRYVYTKYPEFTENSIIKDEILG